MRFSEILLIATAVTGCIWAYDVLFSRYRRSLYVLSSKNETVKDPWWVEYSKSFFPILLIVFLLRSFLAEPFRIPSGSMRPTLLEGDFIVVNKYDYGLRFPLFGTKLLDLGTPKRGDIIVFKHIKNGESIDMIKRVIGLPHDHVLYKDKMIYINGKPVKQEFVSEKTERDERGQTYSVRELTEQLGDIKYKIYVQSDNNKMVSYRYDNVTVPADSYFVLGDNRDNSGDSRFWGFVKDVDVQGRALAIWMSWDSDKYSVRWDRFGRLYSKVD